MVLTCAGSVMELCSWPKSVASILCCLSEEESGRIHSDPYLNETGMQRTVIRESGMPWVCLFLFMCCHAVSLTWHPGVALGKRENWWWQVGWYWPSPLLMDFDYDFRTWKIRLRRTAGHKHRGLWRPLLMSGRIVDPYNLFLRTCLKAWG